MNAHSRVIAGIALLVLAASASAQTRVNCPRGPGAAFGISAYQCASCGYKHDAGARATYSFFSEPVVLQTFGTSSLGAGDVIESVNGKPITTTGGSDHFTYPLPGENTITVRRGRERVTFRVNVVDPAVACAPTDNTVAHRIASDSSTYSSKLRVRGAASADAGGRNFANPFNPETFIPFAVDTSTSSGGCQDGSKQHIVSLRIYNILMQQVAVGVLRGPTTSTPGFPSELIGQPLNNLRLGCGTYTAYWNGTLDATGKAAVSGTYVAQLIVDGRLIRIPMSIADRQSPPTPRIIVDGVVVSPGEPLNNAPTGGYGFAVACLPSCTATTAKEGPLHYTYYRYDGFPPIVAIRAGSPAERAGLKIGDLVTKVDGHLVLDQEGALRLARLDRTEMLRLTVRREGKDAEYVLRIR
jgi:hypothetical protein